MSSPSRPKVSEFQEAPLLVHPRASLEELFANRRHTSPRMRRRPTSGESINWIVLFAC